LGVHDKVLAVEGFRGGLCETSGASPCQTQPVPAGSKRSTTRHYLWENVFKKGQNTAQARKEGKERKKE